jgi:uncharacterized protein
MSTSRIDPLRLDVAALSSQGGRLEGVWPLASLARLAESHVEGPNDGADSCPVDWQASGESRAQEGSPAQVWLHLQAHCRLNLVCQRCLAPVATDVDVDRRLRFVGDEAEAAELDADSDDDVLALARWMNLRDLVEDELLLALPLVPRHEQCPVPLPFVPESEGDEPPDHPFAALERLKGPLS